MGQEIHAPSCITLLQGELVMVELIKFILAVFGLVAICNMFSSMKISLFNRKPFNCSLCMGFWVGGTYAFAFNLTPMIMWASIGASSSWILNKYVTGDY